MMINLPNVFNGGFNGDLVEAEMRTAALRKERLRQLPFELENWNPQALREKLFKAVGAEVDHTLPLDVEITNTIELATTRSVA